MRDCLVSNSNVQMSKTSAGTCTNFGESLQTCKEDCKETADGTSGTCSMTVDLEVCSCKGRNSMVQELKKYSMESGDEVPSGTEETTEHGYIGMCGTCVEYCRSWPGEVQVG